MKHKSLMKSGLMLVSLLFGCGLAFAQPQTMTKEQIVERVQQIDRQLLQLEKAELVKQYQALEAKEKANKPAPTPKKAEEKK